MKFTKGVRKLQRQDDTTMVGTKAQVDIYAYTSMYLGRFEAVYTKDGLWEVETKKSGKIYFNSETLVQVMEDSSRQRFANKAVIYAILI